MFKNHELRVNMVKKNALPVSGTPVQESLGPDIDPLLINDLLKDQADNITRNVLIVLATGFGLSTLSKLIVNKANK